MMIESVSFTGLRINCLKTITSLNEKLNCFRNINIENSQITRGYTCQNEPNYTRELKVLFDYLELKILSRFVVLFTP